MCRNPRVTKRIVFNFYMSENKIGKWKHGKGALNCGMYYLQDRYILNALGFSPFIIAFLLPCTI